MADERPVTKLAWRVGITHWEPDDAFARLLAFLAEHRDIVHEVALFDTITHHLYIPLDTYAARASLMASRLATLREAGVPSAGINVLCTLGHVNEAWDYMPPLPFQPMVGHDGAVATGSACPNSAEHRDYVRAKYALVARAHPDFIWVDDDIRMHGHTIAWGCFCPTCLAMFSERLGRVLGRKSLVAAFDDPACGDVRRAWVEQNVRAIERLLADVAEAVRKVDPDIALGLMTAGAGWTTYSGQAFNRWFTALRATKSRPGGGFYSDEAPFGMYYKALEVGRQRSGVPPAVTDFQYEMENFPYQSLKKAPGTVAKECTLALAAGMGGIAFNALGASCLDQYRPILERVRASRAMWDALVAHVEGLPTAGLWNAWTPRLMARREVRAGEHWLGGDRRYVTTVPDVLGEIGLPLAVDRPACATVLAGRVAEGFSDDDLRGMLAGGVLLDTEALLVLEERGLADLAGVRVGRRVDNGVVERFTADPLNGPHAGDFRDARIEFWGDARGMADVLEPVAEGVRALARLENYFGELYGPCASAFENKLGGRVVVMGYAQWIFLHSIAKREQLLNVADWITRGSLPVRIGEPVRLTPLVRLSEDRSRGAVVLLNASCDELGAATLHVRAPEAAAAGAGVVALLAADGRKWPVLPQREEGGWSMTVVPMAPWSTCAVLFGEAGR